MDEHHAWAYLVHQFGIGGDDRIVGRGPARDSLLREVVVAFRRELAAGHQLHLPGILVVGPGASADAKTLERVFLGQEHRLALEYVGVHRPAGTSALHRVRVVDGPSLLDEVVEPALAPVRRRLVRDACQSAAVPHQERQRAALILRNEELHIHLLDLVDAVGVHLGRHAARREHDLLDWLARDPVLAPAHMEGSHFLQRDRRLRAAREDHRRRHHPHLLHVSSYPVRKVTGNVKPHHEEHENNEGKRPAWSPWRLSGEALGLEGDDCAAYSTLTLASLTTLLHFCASRRVCARNSSGVLPTGSMPSRSSRSRMSETFSTLATSV